MNKSTHTLRIPMLSGEKLRIEMIGDTIIIMRGETTIRIDPREFDFLKSRIEFLIMDFTLSQTPERSHK
jgi:hypothetical protein